MVGAAPLFIDKDVGMGVWFVAGGRLLTLGKLTKLSLFVRFTSDMSVPLRLRCFTLRFTGLRSFVVVS